MKVFQIALETYRIDNNQYPVSTTSTMVSHGADKMSTDVPTFRRYTQGGASSLTTPISYLARLPADPFSARKAPYAYIRYTYPTTWVMWSVGPDGDYDLDWTQFDPGQAMQSPSFFAAYSYDPTNGLVSSGDIWYSKPGVGSIDPDKEREPKVRSNSRHPFALMAATVALLSNDENEKPDKLTQLKKQMRITETGLETYYIDNNAYPVHATDAALSHGAGLLPDNVPTFHRSKPGSAISLTTPIAYLSTLTKDPFTTNSAPFAYVSYSKNWLLWSPGPDGRYDLDWTEFDPTATQQAPSFAAKYSYDPTNGLVSPGDLWNSKGGIGNVR